MARSHFTVRGSNVIEGDDMIVNIMSLRNGIVGRDVILEKFVRFKMDPYLHKDRHPSVVHLGALGWIFG
jgi:hypothetical protein